MTHFTIIWEYDTEESTPLEAAKSAQKVMEQSIPWTYIVQNDNTKEIFQVDLMEEDKNAVIPLPEYKPTVQ